MGVNDNDDEMPAQPKTVELVAADKAAIQHAELKSLLNGLAAMLGDTNSTVSQLIAWKGGIDDRLRFNSMRAQGISQIDMDQDARLAKTMEQIVQERVSRETQIAQEQAAREALTADVAELKKSNGALAADVADLKKSISGQLMILERLDVFTQNKSVKLILLALGAVAASYLGSKGLK